MIFKIGEKIKAINNQPLNGNDIAPELILGNEYKIQDIVLDKKGNQHLDVGLKSKVNYVCSIETGEKLPKGNIIHWCHPLRFGF